MILKRKKEKMRFNNSKNVVNRRNKLNVTDFNENNLNENKPEPRNDLQEEVSSFPAELLYHGEYHDDLPIIEREREKRFSKLSANFLTEHINAEQRRLVVVFMIRLGIHYRYPSYIVYQSVKLFDAFMDKISVETMFIQLAALASLWIALKKQENFDKIPTATDIVALAKDLYIGKEDLLKAYERKILRILDFNITFADAFSLFTHHLVSCKRYIDVPNETTTFLYNCGGYVIDVTLLDEQFCRTSVNLIVRTAMELVFGLVLDLTADSATPRWLFWRGLLFAAIPRPIDRFEHKAIDAMRVAMLQLVLNSGNKHDYAFKVVYKKYSHSRYGRISESFVERATRVSLIESLCNT